MTQHRTPFVRQAFTLRTRVDLARQDGAEAALIGRHQTRNYQTGAEYIAWYEGWRKARLAARVDKVDPR